MIYKEIILKNGENFEVNWSKYINLIKYGTKLADKILSIFFLEWVLKKNKKYVRLTIFVKSFKKKLMVVL
jgi:hypothetical protein